MDPDPFTIPDQDFLDWIPLFHFGRLTFDRTSRLANSTFHYCLGYRPVYTGDAVSR